MPLLPILPDGIAVQTGRLQTGVVFHRRLKLAEYASIDTPFATVSHNKK